MKAVYCVGTHWDREWYEPFQEFRMWLVELIDELMDLMDRDPEYKCFHLDGQAVVLQDYLEIRPERRDRLVSFLKSKRLLAGPWYDLPDEWLISGESYVRNLAMGMRVCRSLGFEPMRFAYTPDQFGHIAALPTIMNGFGLRAGICWRGTQDENYPAHFVWIGPDGSRMVTNKLRDCGSYGPFDFAVRGRLKREEYPTEAIAGYFEPYFKSESERAQAPIVLLLDAIDHQRPDPKMPWLLDELKKRFPDVEFSWTTLEEYGREMLAHEAQLPERTGELREPARAADRGGQYLIVHVLSSRYPIKERNDRCQALLEKWVEPYAAFQAMAGCVPIMRYVDKAWEYLLRNHPHDSIGGCSIDQVHRDMQYRFDQCELIGDGVLRRAMALVGQASDAPDAWPNVVVHNPLPFARSGVFEVAVPFRADWPKKYVDGLATAEICNKFALVDADGGRIPFQLSRIERGVELKAINSMGRKATHGGDVYHLAVEMTLPPCGYAGFCVEPTDEGTRNAGSCMTGVLSASTGLVGFTLHPNGLACLTHEASGVAFDGLFLYEDCGDSGDGWTRGRLIDDIIFRSPGSRVTTAVDEDGALRTVFRAERVFELPRMMERGIYRRSGERVELRVTDRIYVEKGASCVRVRTRIENTCMDHRFRVLFPTHLDTDVSFAETPFAVVERPVAAPPESAAWQERVNPEKAFTSFFGVKTETGGLAVLAPFGLHEYEAAETPDRSLALTLFRSTFKTVGTPGEPDGELLGPLEFEYLLYPFAGVFDAPEALRLVACAQAGVRTHSAAELPAPRSFLRVESLKAVATAIKPAFDGRGIVVRLWNPSEGKAKAVIVCERAVAEASLCNLNEEHLEPLKPGRDGSVAVGVPSRGLATVRLCLA
ncbi:MAG TPA: glycoside hydrolase family 38 C-terminal domain-containing protein [Candidatus Hydrogenedentes bacterium]|nr:glycoside hydrolase family 38 C-terminal domain-containing protein [Candidatus Hydrogenedentota bacterium]HPC15590.1 glycoside hydrolase family 38 C-terminal domain-containing protein [Candidatus Hydrogenedentota bacterium]HRT19410.1 glycoside hydrolase family 38 C-terminal domain-containing protein [Candidatus Hydrogenedentota bacterium]HRT63856.1 glycoside hydrolase family 38 C-terminal domain-containing protein [Candidatus Hydrogenedentota bacterium]